MKVRKVVKIGHFAVNLTENCRNLSKNGAKKCHLLSSHEVNRMNKERGFSLIELLIVVVIIGVVASLAVPALKKGITAAENGNTYATMRTMASTQISFYSQNNRFARMPELNAAMSSALGTVSGDTVTRGKFVLELVGTPSDTDLKQKYTITATRNVPSEGIIYKYSIDESGTLSQLLPPTS